jgi:hypothetical protein
VGSASVLLRAQISRAAKGGLIDVLIDSGRSGLHLQDQARAIPKLDAVVVHKTAALLDGLFIIVANDFFKS